jgi:uncharacterized delta-60 repeat protein
MFKNLLFLCLRQHQCAFGKNVIYPLLAFTLLLSTVPTAAQVSEEWAKRYSRSLTYEAATATDIALDGQGNVFVVGGSGSDIVTVKYSQDGVQQWIKRFDEAHTGYSVAGLIAVDASGNVYVTGTKPINDLYSSDEIITIKYTSEGTKVWQEEYFFDYGASARDMVVDNNGNVYVIGIQSGGKFTLVDYPYTYKINSTGTFAWIRYSFSGISSSPFRLAAITVDNNGNVYVAGTGTGDYGDYTAYNDGPSEDLFATKYNANGDIQWRSRYNSPTNGQESASAIAVDAGGNVFIVGNSNGDYITVKYNFNGLQQWIRTYNNPLYNGVDNAVATALDPFGNLYVTGSSEGSNTGTDYATIKYTTSGVQQWVSRYNYTSNGAEKPARMVVDRSGNVYVTGNSNGSSIHYATIKYNTSGVQQWVTRYNTSDVNGYNQPLGMGVDANGNVYIAGNSVDTYTKSTAIKYSPNGGEQWVKKLENITIATEDKAKAMVMDGSGNVYITGSTIGKDTRSDFTTVKYSPNGTQLWVKHYSTAGDDYAAAIAVDGSGNVYVTGSSFACSNGYSCASYDYYAHYTTVKYSPDGTRQWVKQYDSYSDFNDEATAIAIDGSGNVYVTGTTYAANSNTLEEDFGTIKYGPDGTQLWVQKYHNQFYTNSSDKATAIAIDAQGNIYVTGTSNGGGVGQDYATVKYSSAGSLLWSKIYNGPGNGEDQPASIKVDASGSVYVAGSSVGSGTGQDYALVKYTTSGTQSWVKRYHNGSFDQALGLAVDNCDGIYITGVSRTSNNALVYRTLKYNTAGTIQWIKSYGDGTYPGTHENVAIAVDATCNVYLAGSDNLTDKARYVIIKYSSTGAQLWQNWYQSGATSNDLAVAIAVNGSGNVYVAGSSKATPGSDWDYLTLKLTQQGLPAPWKNGDIGAVALPGLASYKNGVFTIKSGGFDFYKAPDAFHYVYQPFSGNATIIAKVESMGNTNANALAGVMIREDLTASSSFVAAAVNPSNTNFMYRQGAGTPGYKSVPGTAPRWLKLSRSGNSFTSFYSADGVTWTQIGTSMITMGSNVYVGMALTSQNNYALNTATFSNVSVTITSTAPTCSASGSILREYWMNIAGKEVTAIPVNAKPYSSSQITKFEAPSNIGDNYGQRIRGYLCAPASGNYTFYIASDDNSELWLSATDSPASKRKIASVTGWARNGDWVKYPSQKSAIIALEKGKRYYIEALHKEATSGDNLAVAWTIPGSSSIAIIPGSVLSPFVPSAARVASEEILQPSIAVYPNPFDSRVTIATNGWQGRVFISLTDVVGKTCFVQEYVLDGQREIELDLSSVTLSQGMHLLKVQTQDGKTQVIKVIKN